MSKMHVISQGTLIELTPRELAIKAIGLAAVEQLERWGLKVVKKEAEDDSEEMA